MKKKLIAFTTIMFSIATISVFAQVSFKDVASDYWAFNYIDFTAQKGIINGFPDGTFMPADPVTKEQSLAMIYRSMKAANALKSTDDYTSKYLDIMDSYNIAEWARTYVAYALEYNIIDQQDLITFTVESGLDFIGMPASRQEVAEWAAKALGKKTSPLYMVDYLDNADIDTEAFPFIDLMFRYGVMIGDDNNNFRPYYTITRAEFAAVCSRVYNLGSTESFDINKEGYNFSGTITNISDNKISLINSKGIEKTLIISENAGIIINGKESSLNRLEKNSNVTIAYNNIVDNNNILIYTEEDVYQGTIEKLERLSNDIYKITIDNSRGQSISYILDENSDIYDKNNNKKAISYLTSGRNVKYTCDGIKILEIQY
ncbi:MAG: S-layer homology domain-containing protein [Clostridiales bacterium]|nr:S-layer homology domain-containing protein [Clostridiales bacterium]